MPVGWSYLGPSASNGAGDTEGVIVRQVGVGDELVVPITEWRLVWSDAGSGHNTNYMLWHGVARNGYTAVGSAFVRTAKSNGWTPPSIDQSRGIVAIKSSLVVQVQGGRRIWSDAGTGARQDGSAWEISTTGYSYAINTGAFVSANGHNVTPNPVYAIDRTKVNMVE